MRVERADGREVRLLRSLADEHGIRPGATVDDAALDRAAVESERRRAWALSTRFLASRQRSEQEIRSRLTRESFDAAVVDQMVERLRQRRYLDDAQFARAWIEGRIRSRPRGRAVLRAELRARGVADELIDHELQCGYGDEIEIARPLAEKRARRLRGVAFDRFRQSLGAYLVRRGFERAATESLVTELWERYGAPD